MEFLDINLTNGSSLSLHATGGYRKKSVKQENSSLVHEKHFVDRKNKGRKLDKLSSLRLEFIPRKLD
jgi:hypothetical protein